MASSSKSNDDDLGVDDSWVEEYEEEDTTTHAGVSTPRLQNDIQSNPYSSTQMSRLRAIELALGGLTLDSDNTSPRATVPTAPPSRSASFYEDSQPASAGSSNSSINSLFSINSNGSTSSVESVASTVESPEVKALPESVSEFARSSFGTDLNKFIIAHCDETQKLFDDNKIEWGVQYELARGVCSGQWTWAGIRQQIHQLKGTDDKRANADIAPNIQAIMRGDPSIRPSSKQLWQQLDREQAAIFEKKDRGLGLMGNYRGVPNWYGGQIQQVGSLVKAGSTYLVRLAPMESTRSNRVSRMFGSRRLLRISIPEDLLRKENDQVRNFLKNAFILNGRIFMPFVSKGKKVYLIETNENWKRASQEWCSDETRLSFRDFVDWFNPIDENWDQVISKYATRFVLCLSNSVPALEFEKENIYFIDDMTADDWPKDRKKAPAEKLMTDGCGFINRAALHAIQAAVDYGTVPAAVQGRIDGSKGLWILHPTDTSQVPKIWIRESQNKIHNRLFDRAHRIFDLLCASHPSPPMSLSRQSIVNLFANGIPAEHLVRMMEDGLVAAVEPLLQWDNVLFLDAAIRDCGGISGSRVQRVAASLNRVLGFTGRDWHEDDEDSDDEDDDEPDRPLQYTGRNEYSGAALSLHENTIELLQAGFHPKQDSYVQDKMKHIVNTTIQASIKKYRIRVEESLGAFIVPDPLGILEEGEVCYRFSQPRKDPETQHLLFALEGQVLIGRYPIRLPSDIQIVKAVDRVEFNRWTDVLIVSTKGKRSIASLLADGDMDGDEVLVIWCQLLVAYFNNKPFTAPPDRFLERNFDRSVESVKAFCDRVASYPAREAHEAFQEVLMSNLTESQVGLYSSMHEKAALKYGYGGSESVRLAYIFATLLDSSKSGLRLRPTVFSKDSKRYDNSNSPGRFPDVLAMLQEAGEKKGKELMLKYDAQVQVATSSRDKDLKQPYEYWVQVALAMGKPKNEDLLKDLKAIRDHVDAVYPLYLSSCRTQEGQRGKKLAANNSKSGHKQTDHMLLCAQKFAEPVQGIKFIQTRREVERVKASYAYVSKYNPAFGFAVAFQALCVMKAEALGTIAPTIRIFDESRTPNASYLRAVKRAEEDLLSSAQA